MKNLELMRYFTIRDIYKNNNYQNDIESDQKGDTGEKEQSKWFHSNYSRTYFCILPNSGALGKRTTDFISIALCVLIFSPWDIVSRINFVLTSLFLAVSRFRSSPHRSSTDEWTANPRLRRHSTISFVDK